MHRRLGNSAVPGNLLGLARLYERIINDEPPLAIQGARIGSHSVFHFFHRQMCCCTRDSCHTFPLLFSVITSFILSQYADWYETSLGFSCSACVRRNWGGCLLYCGDRVSVPAISEPAGTIVPFIIVLAVPMTATSRSLIEGSFAFILPIFPLPGCLVRLEASLDVTPRFPPHRWKFRREGLETALDTRLGAPLLHSTQATSGRTHQIIGVTAVVEPLVA